MNWFAKNGDKLLTLVTVVIGILVAMGSAPGNSLGIPVQLLAWLGVTSAIAAAIHTLYFPNTQVVAPTAASTSINTGKGS